MPLVDALPGQLGSTVCYGSIDAEVRVAPGCREHEDYIHMGVIDLCFLGGLRGRRWSILLDCWRCARRGAC